MIVRVFRTSLCLLLLFQAYAARSQENPERLDSILPLLDPASKDTNQLRMLIWASESWTTSPNAWPYLRRLDSLSNELLLAKEPRIRERARHARGAYHFFVGYHAKFERNIPQALHSFQQAIKDFDAGGHRHAVGQCLDGLGLVYGLADEQDRAEAAFRKELEIGREIGHDGLRTQALVHLASVQAARGHFANARLSLDMAPARTPSDSTLVLIEMAHVHALEGSRDEAERSLRKSLEVASRTTNAWDSLPALTPLIRLLYTSGRQTEGLLMARTCVRLAERMGDATAHCGCINLVADGLRDMGHPDQAEPWYRKGLALAEHTGNIGAARELGDEGSMLYASDGLRGLYKSQGRLSEALAMSELWSMLKDSVQRMNGREEVLTARFMEEAIRDSLVSVAERQQRALAEDRRASRDRLRLSVAVIIVLLALILALAFWSRARLLRRTNHAILSAQQEVVNSEKRREAEEVRTRIARDVHDQLGSDLTKLVMLGTEVNASVKDDPAAVPMLAARIEHIASDATRSLSDIVWAVDHANDSLSRLIEHSRRYCERMLAGSGIDHTIECRVEGRDRSIDPATRRDLYLILREAVNNAVKYADADGIEVVFVAHGNKVLLTVKDDGRGFNLPHAMRQGHGLGNLKARAERMGGSLVIASEPGGGTLIRFEVELKDP